jgi:hypothetical protein
MKSLTIYIAFVIVAVAMIIFTAPAKAQTVIPLDGWHRVSSTMDSDTLEIMSDGTAPEGNYFMRLTFDGSNTSQEVTWARGGFDVPFQGTLKATPRSSGTDEECWTAAMSFGLTLYNKDTAITSYVTTTCGGPWGGVTFSPPGDWSGSLSHFDSMAITIRYFSPSTTFPQFSLDFDNWRVTIDGNDELFYSSGDVGSISGVVFSDTNHNSLRDVGEAGLADVQVFLTGTHADTVITDSLGNYRFSNLEHGAYTVTSPVTPGWAQTMPTSGNYTVTIGPSGLQYLADFGNYLTTAQQYLVKKGWNLISAPLALADYSVATLFPTATSACYSYDPNTGYQQAETLTNGPGYWLKFNHDQFVYLNGTDVTSDTVTVVEGWNLVGALSAPTLATEVTSDDPELTLGGFWRYTGSYRPTDTLGAGGGYWVKASKSGSIMFSSNPAGAAAFRVHITQDDELPPAAPGGEVATGKLPIATSFQLEQNYPNPFNPVTRISFQVPSQADVSLVVYDLLGQKVATLVNEPRAAGTYEVTFNASNIPSGVYLYRLTVNGRSANKTMILLK